MKGLLHLQYKMNKRGLLINVIAITMIGLLFMRSTGETTIPIIAFILSMGTIRGASLLKDKNTRMLVHSFPIKRRTIVTGTYVSVLFYLFMFYSLLAPFQVVKGQQQADLHNFLVLYVGFFAAIIAYAAVDLYGMFKGDPSQESTTDSLLISFGAIFFIMLPHSLLSSWEHEPSFYLRLFVFPVISIMLFYFSLQKSIRLYETKEIM